MTNGNFPGAPPIWELAEEPAEGIDTKASVIESLATAKWKEAHPVDAAEPVATTGAPPEAAPEELAVITDEVAEAVAEEVIGAALEEVVTGAVEEMEKEGVPGDNEADVGGEGGEAEPEVGG